MSPVQFTNTAFPASTLSQHLPLQDNRSGQQQVAREAREVIHIRVNNRALNC